MSALGRRALAPRAASTLPRCNNLPPLHSSSLQQYGRTPAYRTLSTHRSSAATRQQNASSLPTITPSPLRSQFLPSAISTIQSRNVSFREMQKERQRQKAGESARKPASEPNTTSKSKSDPEPTKTDSKPASAEKEFDAAEEAYRAAARESFGKQKAEKEVPPESEAAPEAEGAEGAEGQKKEKKAAPPPPKHGNKSPWQVFTETLQTEFKASKEWNESQQQLQGSIHDFQQNPNVQKAATAYSKATETAASTASATLKSTAGAIGSGAAWTWDTSVVKGLRKGATVVGSGLEKATRPVRETEAFKNVKEVIDDGSSSRYGGWVEKEERRKRREAKELEAAAKNGGRRPSEPLVEDPDAGVNVTLHKDAKWKESWREFRDSSKTMQRLFSMKSAYAESENPIISTARGISDKIAGFFAENETAMVIKKFREMDPAFQVEPFLTEMREYILPEVLDAYVKGDVETLKLWLSAAQYQVYAALMQQYTQHGLKSDGRILDIRNVDILNARLLEPGDIPVFVIMCRTQEVHVYRNKKTGELASGMEDKVQQVTYAIGVTRLPEEVANPETRGWRLIELQKSGRDYI